MAIQIHEEGFILADCSSGMIDDTAVSDSLVPRNSVRKAVNVSLDSPIGSVRQRLGTTKLGATVNASGAVQGLYDFRSTTANQSFLLATAYGKVYYYAPDWTELSTGYSTSLKMRFITYLNTVAWMNGSDAVKGWTGTGAVITTGGNLDIGNFPVTKFAHVLNGRVFAAGNSTYPYRLYASSIVSAGSVSWTSGNKTVDVYPNDGSGAITGLALNGRMLLVFKDRTMFRYDDNTLERVVGIGSPSHESIVNDDAGMTYFFGQGANGVGFYVTTGGYPMKLSRPVQKWVDAIAPAYYDDVAAYTNGKKIVWSIGSVTVDGTTYANAALVYNIADRAWEARSYADRFGVFSQYINSSGAITVVGGDSDGMVQTIDSGYTDNGTPIYSECEFVPFVGDSRGTLKMLDEFQVYTKHYQGLNFHMRPDQGEFLPLGSVTETTQTFSNLGLRGHVFYPKITCANSGEPFELDGFNFIRWGTEGYGDS